MHNTIKYSKSILFNPLYIIETNLLNIMNKFLLLSMIITNTGCPKKNLPVCFLAITTSNLHQIQKGRSVLKSACSEDFKTDPTFDIWPTRS